MTRSIRALAILGAFGLALVLVPTGAGAGTPTTLIIHKVVVGDPPAGTTFTAHADCVITTDRDFDFPAAGGTHNENVVPDETCTVTETVAGGATSTTFGATATAGATPASTATDASCDFFRPGATCTVTITNTFPVAPTPPAVVPAQAVPVAPAFTG